MLPGVVTAAEILSVLYSKYLERTRTMTDLTADDIATMNLMIDGQCKAAMDELIKTEDMLYQGFDPNYLLSVLYGRGKAAGKTLQDITKDLKTLALIGTIRGSSIRKIIGQSTQEAREFLTRARATYTLVDGRPRTKNDATLPRISALCAAAVCIFISANADVRTPVEASQIHVNFPRCMCMSKFGNLIPKTGLQDNDVKMLTHAFCYHQYRFDRLIKNNPNNYANKDTIRRYVGIQIMSNFYTDAQRLQTLVKAGILSLGADGGHSIKNEYRPGLQSAANAWEELI